jgi:redox-sensitive bicupin YhaK (pirin superfamily)
MRRMIELVIDQRRKDLGGFEVGRVLPWAKRRMVGPFVFFDHMGPADFPPGISRTVDVRPHPHIGLSTITYLFDGEIMHRDSLGTVQPIRAGEVNWMTAGRGITPSERFEKARLHGDRLHGIQNWVALPEAEEETAPEFSHHAMEDQPLYEDAGITGRLVAGRAFGVEAKARTQLKDSVFVDRDYKDKKSKPEYGINLSEKNIEALEEYRFDDAAVKTFGALQSSPRDNG